MQKSKLFFIIVLACTARWVCSAGPTKASGVLPGVCRLPQTCYTCHHSHLSENPQNCAACHSGHRAFACGPACCRHGVYGTIGTMVIGRWSAQYTLLPDNRVLTTGGYSNYIGLMQGLADTFEASAEIFDPATGTSRLLEATMSSPRINHTATLLDDGTVLIAGGATSRSRAGGELLATAELFDPATETFTPAGSLQIARCRHTATLLDDGRVLIAGGSTSVSYAAARGRRTAELYDPATGTFTLAWPMTAPRQNHAAVPLDDGRVFLAGGSRGPATGHLLASTEFFDPLTGLFARGPEMSAARLGNGTIRLRDGRVLMGPAVEYEMLNAFRGQLPLVIRNDSEIFDPVADAFTPSDPQVPESAYMHEIGEYQTFALPDGTILRADGGDEVWEFPVSHLYDPKTDTYANTGPVQYPRWEKNAVMLRDGRPLEIGGYHMLYGFIRQIEAYTPSLESQIAGLENTLSDLPAAAFTNSAARDLLAGYLADIAGHVAGQDFDSARTAAETDVRAAVDGCFDGQSADDLITDCTFQGDLYYPARLLADTLERTVTGNQPPTAAAFADVRTGEKPLEVTFSGSGTDEDGAVLLYDWDFGDYHLGNGQTVSHEYPHAGTYTVTLTVIDDYGAEATASLTVSVTEHGQQRSISYQARIQPVLDAFCHNCHPAGGAGGRRLSTYEAVMDPGESGPIVVPGDPDESRLVQYLESGHPIAHAPHGYGSAFVQDIRAWITDGALDN